MSKEKRNLLPICLTALWLLMSILIAHIIYAAITSVNDVPSSSINSINDVPMQTGYGEIDGVGY